MKVKCILLLLFFICIVMILAYLQPLSSYQETYLALIIKETSHHLLHLTCNGNSVYIKHPLYIWISGILYKFSALIAKEGLFILRLLSVSACVSLLVALYLFFENNFSRFCLSALILFSNIHFLSFIYKITPEPLFVLFSFLMFFCAYFYVKTEKIFYKIGFYLFLSLGFLTKGCLILFLLPSFFIYALLFRNKNMFKLLFYPSGWLLSAILVSPWYLYGYLYFKESIAPLLFINKSPSLPYKALFYYYFKTLILSFLIFFILFLWTILKTKGFCLWRSLKEENTALIFFSAFIPVILLVFTGKILSNYLLYIYPFWAVFFAIILDENFSFFKNFLFIYFILIVLSYGLVQFSREKDLRYKVGVVKANINSHQKLVFWQDEMPLIIYYYGKPIKVLKNKKELDKYLQKGYMIISSKLLPGLVDKFIILDPYKKDKIWYFMTKETNSSLTLSKEALTSP